MAKTRDKSAPAAQHSAASAPEPGDFRNRMPSGARGEEIDSGDVEVIVKFAEGDELSGRYRGSKKTRSSKPDEQSTLHKFETVDGQSVGVWGCYQLDAKLAKLSEGEWVWIMYTGMQRMQSGKDMHTYKVVRIAQPTEAAELPAGRAGDENIPF